MIEAALIERCSDPELKPAIVERFIAEAGSSDPPTVTVRSRARVVLVPKPTTPDEAMALMHQYVGKAIVRVGITQHPAGLGISDRSELKPDLVDACENIRMGTALFGKVYRIVTKWYGKAVDEAFDDAIYAWRTGYFRGKGHLLRTRSGRRHARHAGASTCQRNGGRPTGWGRGNGRGSRSRVESE